MSNSTAVSNKAIERSMLIKTIAFVAPYLGLSLLLGPVVAVLGGIYAKHYGLALTTIAAVMLAARIFDAVTDPLIGYYSDQWRVRTGSRKPFMVVGGLLLVPCSYFLFVPPEGVGGIYFAFWYMTFYLALTIFVDSLFGAWANEFTMRPRKRKRWCSALSAAVGHGRHRPVLCDPTAATVCSALRSPLRCLKFTAALWVPCSCVPAGLA